jgi:hypothetical protein
MSLVPPSHREGLKNTADSYEQLGQRVIVRRDTADGWLKNDPVLEAGEFGYEIGYPTGKVKIGTGSTRWTELPYLMARGPAGQPGAPGPAGPPGKGIQIKGVADVWPPPGAPEIGDLWILGDPLPPTAPAGSAPGDGYSWSGTKWVPTGPIQGPEGPAGADGTAVSVFSGTTTPTANNAGDMWLKPDPSGTILSIWDGTQWVVAASGGTAGNVTVDTTSSGSLVGLTSSPNLPLQQWSDEMSLKAAFQFNSVDFTGVKVIDRDSTGGGIGDPVNGEGWVRASYGFFGNLFYGTLGSRATGEPGYELPTPTQQGYLRADQDPASGWYFAEPVIVSATEPPTPPGDPSLPTIWIDPDGTPPDYIFSNVNPPVSVDPPVMETATSPIGIINNNYIEPEVVGAVPVVVNGKRYLLPLLEAPASTATRIPMFTFADDPIKQQLDGSWIGLDDTGTAYYQPETVGAIPVLVGGKKYLLPLIEE